MVFVRKFLSVPLFMYHSMKTKRLFRTQNYSKSRRHFEKIHGNSEGFLIFPSGHHLDAFLATLLLHEDRIDEAKEEYRYVEKETSGSVDGNSRYVNRYCSILLDKMEGNKVSKEFLRDTKELNCDNYVKEWLPLS